MSVVIEVVIDDFVNISIAYWLAGYESVDDAPRSYE